MYLKECKEVEGMLLQFKFSNSRCFVDETVFDMTATSIKEHSYSLIERNGVNILPVAAIYGANASGKSSFFMAFERMRRVILNRFSSHIFSNEMLKKGFNNPFIFDDDIKNSPSSYEISILIDKYEYRYGFSCTNDQILTEYLYKRLFSRNDTVEKIIFEREGLHFNIGKVNQSIKKEVEYCASMVSNESLILTDIGLRKKEEELYSIFFWIYETDVLGSDIAERTVLTSYGERLIGSMLSEITMRNDFKNKYIEIVHEVDPSISGIECVDKVDSEGKEIKVAMTKHIFNGKEKLVPLELESDGTNKWLLIALCVLMCLESGSVCFIDELDSKLHPLILRKVVQLFTDKETNPNGAQLVFSAHNIINLDPSDLRRDEIWFVEKNDHKSQMYSLVDFDDGGIRSDLSYGKYYLSGRFGAVPFQE